VARPRNALTAPIRSASASRHAVRGAFLKDPSEQLNSAACASESPPIDFITSLK
jgi:hypothetical protein